MTSVADSIGIRSNGIAGETLAKLDLARARSFSRASRVPPFVEGRKVCPWRGSQHDRETRRRHRADGPFAMTFVNPVDDPKKEAPAT